MSISSFHLPLSCHHLVIHVGNILVYLFYDRFVCFGIFVFLPLLGGSAIVYVFLGLSALPIVCYIHVLGIFPNSAYLTNILFYSLDFVSDVE